MSTCVFLRYGTIPACAGSSSWRRLPRRCPGDHPRVRGEQPAQLSSAPIFPGPSPRARGADQLPVPLVGLLGTIPACAGSRSAAGTACRTPGDHPRVRGEQRTPPSTCTTPAGPSPRARGAGVPPRPDIRLGGTIPACAGSRMTTVSATTRSWDHPRVRGEQIGSACGLPDSRGPSPRARGAATGASLIVDVNGTIPACAGSSTASTTARGTTRDHPRVRGEQPRTRPHDLVVAGPSPRARGAEVREPTSAGLPGTIPACAGSSRSGRPSGAAGWDHPRVRGEQVDGQRSDDRPVGPSPRARGAVLLVLEGFDLGGTIPACAGSRPEPAVWPPLRRDHPRVRGEQRRAATSSRDSPGPSPRARGAVAGAHRRGGGMGTIPACAGSS